MTKQQAISKTMSLYRGGAAFMREAAERYVNSGAVNLALYGDNYELPRILLVAGLEDVARAYGPQSPANKAELAKLRHF